MSILRQFEAWLDRRIGTVGHDPPKEQIEPPEPGKYVVLALFQYYNNFLGAHLQRAGITVRKTPSLQAALEQIGEVRPGLVIVFIGPDGPSALDLLHTVRRAGNGPCIPVLGIVGKDQSDLLPDALGAGLSEFIAIPCHPLEIVSTVCRLMGEPFSCRETNILENQDLPTQKE